MMSTKNLDELIAVRRKPTREIDGSSYTSEDEVLLTTSLAAAYMNFQPDTLKRWRYANRGPVYLKLGQSVRYRQADIDTWLSESRRVTSAGEAAEQ